MKRFIFSVGAILVMGNLIASPGETTCVSTTSTGAFVNSGFSSPRLSGDGRYVAFSTSASLIPEDTNSRGDVYVRDLVTGTLARASLTDTGAQVADSYTVYDVSHDGRYILLSGSDKIIPGTDNGFRDIFRHDMVTGQNIRASLASDGSQGNKDSVRAAISSDGRYVVFESQATNIVPGDTNAVQDVFVRDIDAGTTVCASVNSSGVIGNHSSSRDLKISTDGRYVCFNSNANNLVAGDTNGIEDVFVRDLAAGVTIRANVSNTGVQMRGQTDNQSMSANGRFVAFMSTDPALVAGDSNGQSDIFVRDLLLNTTTLVSKSPLGVLGTLSSVSPAISEDGRFVAFRSLADNLIPGDTNRCVDLLVADRQVGTLRLMSRSTGNVISNDDIDNIAISDNGSVVAFSTFATNLGGGGTSSDIFIHELEAANAMTALTLAKNVLAGQNRTTGTIQMALPAVFGGEPISLIASSPSVFLASPIYVPIAATTKSFAVNTFPVAASTAVTLTAAYGTQTISQGLTLNPLLPSAFAFTPNSVVGGNPVSARLVINGVAPPTGFSINLTDNSPFATTPANVMVPNAGTEVVFSIATLPVTAPRSVTVTASVPQGFKTGVFVIKPAP